MAKRPKLSEVLLTRRERVTKGTRKRSTAQMTRAERLRLAPKPSNAAGVQYLRGFRHVLDLVKAEVEKIVIAQLPILVPSSGVISKADPHDAQIGVKHDSAEVCPYCKSGHYPAWYGHARAVALDIPGGRYSEVLGDLEVALTRIVAPKNLIRLVHEVANTTDKRNRAEMTRILEIDFRNDPTLSTFLDDFTRRNVNLIQSVTFDQLAEVNDLIAEGTAGQIRVEDLATRIRESFGVSDARAQLIARDQTLKANAQLSQLRQQQSGVEAYFWTTSNDERVRGNPGGLYPKSQSNHWVLDGTRQLWVRAPLTNPKTGAHNHPGEDYQCRCVAIPDTSDIF